MRGRELRWLIVFKRRFVGLDPDVVAEQLCCPVISQDRYLALYDAHGDMFRPKAGSRGRPTKLNALEELDLVAAVLAAPCMKVHDHRARLLIDGGQALSLSTLGRILHKHNITRLYRHAAVLTRVPSSSARRVVRCCVRARPPASPPRVVGGPSFIGWTVRLGPPLGPHTHSQRLPPSTAASVSVSGAGHPAHATGGRRGASHGRTFDPNESGGVVGAARAGAPPTQARTAWVRPCVRTVLVFARC